MPESGQTPYDYERANRILRSTQVSKPDNHPGTPQKAIYYDCPACLQTGVQTRLVVDNRGVHCPECNWKNYEELVSSPAGVFKMSEVFSEAAAAVTPVVNGEPTGIPCPSCGLSLPRSGNCDTCRTSWEWTPDRKDLRRKISPPIYEKCGSSTCFGCTGDRPNLCDKLLPQKVVHATGATRSSEADGWRYDLIPQRGLERVAKTCHEGAVKYTPHNWKKGFAWSVMIAHATKHIAMWLMGDKSEDHLAHACWNLLALMDYEVIHPELNDIPERAADYDPSQSTGSSS